MYQRYCSTEAIILVGVFEIQAFHLPSAFEEVTHFLESQFTDL